MFGLPIPLTGGSSDDGCSGRVNLVQLLWLRTEGEKRIVEDRGGGGGGGEKEGKGEKKGKEAQMEI